MKKDNKKIIALLLAGSMAAISVGCGDTKTTNTMSDTANTSNTTQETEGTENTADAGESADSKGSNADNTADSEKETEEKKQVELDPDNPTTVTIWNYYNGDQQAAFDKLVAEFNETEGAKKGIIVVSVGQGSISNLVSGLLDSVEGKTGALDVPTMASVYAETGYILDEKELLVNLDEYFTQEELDKYIDNFIQEGRMTEEGNLVLFPVSKSTECFVVNTTDWAAFQDAAGISIESIDSLEKLTAAAEKYYNWTDSLTPDVKDDGKALYGRDSVSNYIYIGAKQLGHEMFSVSEDGVSVDLDKDVFRKLWDNFYIPYVNGYFLEEANYRSEDLKTGNILCMTGSTSGISYLPTGVTDKNDETHDIDLSISPQLMFEDAESDVAVQQGAGYCVFKSSEEEQYAAVEFLKWFTDSQRNLDFSAISGYSPVTVEANKKESIESYFKNVESSAKNDNIKETLLLGSDIFENRETYTSKPFSGCKEIRDVLGEALEGTAVADRKAVLEDIAGGMSHEAAVAPYVTDEYFENWYKLTSDAVNKLIDK